MYAYETAQGYENNISKYVKKRVISSLFQETFKILKSENS